MIEERRKYVRLNVKIEFTYKKKGVPGPEKKSVTKNISLGGIQADLDASIKQGDWLELNITIPHTEKPIYCIAKIVWLSEETAGKITAGIKFEDIACEMKNKFMEYMCEIMYDELKKSRLW